MLLCLLHLGRCRDAKRTKASAKRMSAFFEVVQVTGIEVKEGNRKAKAIRAAGA